MFKTILFPVDISEEDAGKASLPVVHSYALAFDAKVLLLTVIPDYEMSFASHLFDLGVVEKICGDTEKSLLSYAKKNLPGIKTDTLVKQGTVYETIINTARDVKADLIIMSAHRPELKDYLLGPNAARVVRHSDCSVLVVRE